MTKVLMVLSAADKWTLKDGSTHPTGFWAEEFVVPYDIFSAAGFDITVATPGGKAPTVDKISLGPLSGQLPKKIKETKARLRALKPVLDHPEDVHTQDHNQFDLVFYPGGHGPMEDLAADEKSGALLADRLQSGKLLALLCHSPAAVLGASGGGDATESELKRNPFAGRKITGLSNLEERMWPFSWKAKWMLENKLKQAGLQYNKGFPLRSHVVVDGNLYSCLLYTSPSPRD